MKIDRNTPIAMMTIGQLIEAMSNKNYFSNNEIIEEKIDPLKKYAYGLKGIRELFNVSHATAYRYKETFLKPAIMQNERKIVVDIKKALELFNAANVKK